MAAAETSFFKEMAVVKLLFLLMLLPEAAISSGQNWSSGGMSNVEDEYLKWIKHMGSFRHSLFEKAKNKFKPCLTLKVSKKPKAGAFRSVQKAINSLPVVNRCRVVIRVGAGTYREKVEIPATMSYIWVEGEGAEKTIIEWDDTADHMGENGRPLGTFASATFAVNSPFFIARNVTFKNKATLPPSGALGKQAVAFRISADAAAFIRCKFIGAQDTLYDHIGRHYFKDCYIEGSVDFVFGDGLSIYDGCHLHAISNSYGALTAQKRNSLLEETGFSFVNCRVSGSGALYLGRAWGSFSRVVFAYTFMDKIITPTGWYNWGDKNREIKKRQRLKRRRTWVITLDAGLCFMDNTGVRDQELIMEDEFPGRENSLSRRPTRFSLLILSMQTNGFQRTSIRPSNDIEFVVFLLIKRFKF